MRRYSPSTVRVYALIACLVASALVSIFSSWLSALAFLEVLLGGGIIALIIRRSEKDGI
jgi:hypothetical protein